MLFVQPRVVDFLAVLAWMDQFRIFVMHLTDVVVDLVVLVNRLNRCRQS